MIAENWSLQGKELSIKYKFMCLPRRPFQYVLVINKKIFSISNPHSQEIRFHTCHKLATLILDPIVLFSARRLTPSLFLATNLLSFSIKKTQTAQKKRCPKFRLTLRRSIIFLRDQRSILPFVLLKYELLPLISRTECARQWTITHEIRFLTRTENKRTDGCRLEIIEVCWFYWP